MKHISDVANAVAAGLRPVVTFKKGIEEKESYPEAGMRARLIAAQQRADSVIRLTVSYAEFDEFNKQFETANYYGLDRQPNKTAREAGKYEVEEVLYFDVDELTANSFDIESSARLELHVEYRAASSAQTYVQWLEDQLLSAREALAAASGS